MKKRSIVSISMILAFALLVLCSCASTSGSDEVIPTAEVPSSTAATSKPVAKKYIAYDNTPDERVISGAGTEGIGDVKVYTLMVDSSFAVRRATYSYSGRVLIGYSSGYDTVVCSLNDDGTDLIEVFRGRINSSYRLLPFSDNRRILMGDYILECPEGTTLDDCPTDSAILVDIIFPEEFRNDPNVTDSWTEVIISQDCEHLAWTIRRSDCGAVNAMGRIVRTEEGYVIEDAKYISNMNPLSEDPNEEGYSIYTPVIGGEVKQFVRGGAAISLVGSDISGMADSVVQDVATGEVTQLTFTPGYDETTMVSPDERLGITMTTRFSETTDMAVLGLMPRPMGQPLHNILGQVYMYGVTGVRSGRAGNIGPALINLSLSASEKGYKGVDLSDPEEKWVFLSPLSWNIDSKKAMWVERLKNGYVYRVRIVSLLDYEPGEAVAFVQTPEVGDYAAAPSKLGDYDAVVKGKFSGTAHLTKKSGNLGDAEVTVVYDNYSDDGIYFYNGTETSYGSVITETSYDSDLKVTDADGNVCGQMDVTMNMSAGYSLTGKGNNSPKLDLSTSNGEAFWLDSKADMTSLVN